VSAVRKPALRLAHASPQPVVDVTLGARSPLPAGHSLVLLPPLPVMASLVPATMSGDGRDRSLAVRLSLPGIGTRYLLRVAQRAAQMGWGIDELAALMVELERRCAHLVVAPELARLAPDRRRRRWLDHDQALWWEGGAWVASRGRPSDLLAAARNSGLRGYGNAVACSGAGLPRRIAGVLDELAALGVTVRTGGGELSLQLGARWAVELLGTPQLSPAQLQALRERFAAAPRCDWCGVPVVGRHCHRCTAGGSA
jgi:hypothetical protein